jgi:hypothetical protein
VSDYPTDGDDQQNPNRGISSQSKQRKELPVTLAISTLSLLTSSSEMET